MLARATARALAPLGHITDVLMRGHDARHALQEGGFDLVLLDLGLPDVEGLELLRELRSRGDNTPVLILTARDSVDDRVRGLDLGADDYLAKPFQIAELEARVRALLRRSQQRTSDALCLGTLHFNIRTVSATLDGAALELPRRELHLLESLLSQAGQLVTRETLEARLFGFDAVGPNALDVYVSRLRKRLEGHGLRIRTVRGLGYLLEEFTP